MPSWRAQGLLYIGYTHIMLSSLLIGYQIHRMNKSECKEYHYLLNCPTMSLFFIISVLGRAIARMSSVTLQTVIILEQLLRMLAYITLRALSNS